MLLSPVWHSFASSYEESLLHAEGFDHQVNTIVLHYSTLSHCLIDFHNNSSQWYFSWVFQTHKKHTGGCWTIFFLWIFWLINKIRLSVYIMHVLLDDMVQYQFVFCSILKEYELFFSFKFFWEKKTNWIMSSLSSLSVAVSRGSNLKNKPSLPRSYFGDGCIEIDPDSSKQGNLEWREIIRSKGS